MRGEKAFKIATPPESKVVSDWNGVLTWGDQLGQSKQLLHEIRKLPTYLDSHNNIDPSPSPFSSPSPGPPPSPIRPKSPSGTHTHTHTYIYIHTQVHISLEFYPPKYSTSSTASSSSPSSKPASFAIVYRLVCSMNKT